MMSSSDHHAKVLGSTNNSSSSWAAAVAQRTNIQPHVLIYRHRSALYITRSGARAKRTHTYLIRTCQNVPLLVLANTSCQVISGILQNEKTRKHQTINAFWPQKHLGAVPNGEKYHDSWYFCRGSAWIVFFFFLLRFTTKRSRIPTWFFLAFL